MANTFHWLQYSSLTACLLKLINVFNFQRNVTLVKLILSAGSDPLSWIRNALNTGYQRGKAVGTTLVITEIKSSQISSNICLIFLVVVIFPDNLIMISVDNDNDYIVVLRPADDLGEWWQLNTVESPGGNIRGVSWGYWPHSCHWRTK